MKCATSSLFEALGRHPQVFVSNPKDPRFFCKDEIFPHFFESFVERLQDVMSPSYEFWEADSALSDADRFEASHVSAQKQIDRAVLWRIE
jgi:hypothetical protein